MATQAALGEIQLSRYRGGMLYQQLRGAIKHLISRGALAAGDRLPPQAEVADICGVSLATVTRAFRELAEEGVFDSRPGRGTFIAEMRELRTTEIIVEHAEPEHGTHWESFMGQFSEGVGAGFDEVHRRFLTTHDEHGLLNAREIIGTARARGTDSVIAYHPGDRLVRELAQVALELPCVSIRNALAGSQLDAVTINPDDALRGLLEARMERGVRSFAYVGLDRVVESTDPYYTFGRMCSAFRSALDDAGIGIEWITAKKWSVFEPTAGEMPSGETERLLAKVKSLAEGTVVVAHSPAYAAWAMDLNPGLDVVCYTESQDTLERYGRRMSILYLAGEELAAAGVSLLKERLSGVRQEAKTLELRPLVVEAVAGRP